MGDALPHLTRSSRSGPYDLVVFLRQGRLRLPLPEAGTVVLGRSPEADLRVQHRSISRQHLRIHCGEGACQVEELGSRNGTRLIASGHPFEDSTEETHNAQNDCLLSPGALVTISPGDMLRVGNVLLRVDRRTEGSRAENSPSERPLVAIGEDPKTRAVFELAERYAASDIAVLILGETGVGKDVLAQAIHAASRRANAPFVRIHCAALSENLLESELFGHQKGAFTGAVTAKEGLIESADGGTVFLDELGELPLATQVKLLNVLESGEVLRVGATRARRIDVRFVAATNRDLPAEIALGRFRKDLFFRINAATLRLPPLRERPGDLEALSQHFLERYCERAGIEPPALTNGALDWLKSYRWPGNVRELRNTMERAPLLSGGDAIAREHLEVDLGVDLDFDVDTTGEFERAHEPRRTVSMDRQRVVQALEACGGNQTRAAEMLGISRRTLVNWLDSLNLPRPRKRSRNDP